MDTLRGLERGDEGPAFASVFSANDFFGGLCIVHGQVVHVQLLLYR